MFDDLANHEFYGPKFTHIYFYDRVSADSVVMLQSEIRNVSISKEENGVQMKPKPIALHINSPGGDAAFGLSLVNMLTEIRIPYVVIVDGYACSAVTPLLVSSQYRIMNDAATVLIHEGFIFTYGRDGDVKHNFEYFNTLSKRYTKIYEETTKIPHDILADLEQRDKFLSAKECLDYGIVDRVLPVDPVDIRKIQDKYYKKNPEYNFKVETLLWKTNFNHIYMVDVGIQRAIMSVQKFSTTESSKNVKPIIFHINRQTVDMYEFNEIIAFLVHVHMQTVPTIGIIDNDIDLLNALPYLCCHKKYMYEGTIMMVHLMTSHSMSWSYYYHDFVPNVTLLRNTICHLLQKFTRIPKHVVSDLFTKRMLWSAEECLKYGLIDGIIKPIKRGKAGVVGCEFGQRSCRSTVR